MSRDELKRVFKLLRKHEDILVSAYLEGGGVIDESEIDISAIEMLVNTRLLWIPASDEPVRLTRELTGLFDRVLRDPRRLTLDADIGGFVNNIESSVNRYREAIRLGFSDDASHYLSQIERLVDELRSSLLDSSGQLWQKINSEFGYVGSLNLKIKENETVLNQAKLLNDRLELIKVREMDELAGSDYQLRRYLNHWLLGAVELCRRETVDAIHKLNELLFEHRKQQSLGRIIDSFYRRFQSVNGYKPIDYASMGDIPQVFNQVTPINLTAYENADDPCQEVTLTQIISGLRKDLLKIEEPEPALEIDVLPEEPPIKKSLAILGQAVEDFYLKAIESGTTLSAIKCCPDVEIEPDMEIWLYAVIARFNNMEQSERVLFNMEYKQTEDPIFNGRHLVQDVHVSVNLADDSNFNP
ncbi:hypothetical protein [Cycloclasticus pugetii]|jgi:hypothetical protein|nr:hypothetical protein [Cycloclasticus pugetii]SHJ70212.1 hypothetical protein SAMN05519226_0063 [Cycloclasticus pugetii]